MAQLTQYFAKIFMIVLICLSAAQPAFAQSKKDLAYQDTVMMNRITALENRMVTGDPAAERLMQRMDSLEESVRMMTGEVERLRYERDQARAETAALSQEVKTLKDLSERTRLHLDAVDIADRMQAENVYQAPPPVPFGQTSQTLPFGAPVNTVPSYTPPAPPPQNTASVGVNDLAGGTGPQAYFPSEGQLDPNQPTSIGGPPVMSEQVIGVQSYGVQSYTQNQTGRDTLREDGQQKLAEGDFTGAQNAFRQYLDLYPEAGDAGEVSFWLGESYFVKGGYADAADAYIASMRKAPNGEMAPEALVGLAATLRELGKKTEACSALDSLPSQYPNASADVRNKARVVSARTGC